MSATSRVERWLDRAILEAACSTDPDLRDRVGCSIVSGDELLGWGCNHSLDGSYMRDTLGKARPFVVHAETAAIQDALVNAGERQQVPLYLQAYCTKEPCMHCLVQLANACVDEIHFIDAIPYAKSGRGHLQHFPSIKVYKEHHNQLPKLLRVLGVHAGGGTEPASGVAPRPRDPAETSAG
jgi:deoxycytidylate deaminase